MGGFMTFFQSNYQAILWLMAAVVLVVIETGTAQMVCIWFAVGAVCGVFAAVAGLNPVWQFLIFLVVSAATLLFTRPFVNKILHVKKTATNADSNIGLCGSVLEEINNVAETGRVRVNGLDWTARTSDNSVIHIGETVVVGSINGVKLIVLRKV